MQTKLKVLMLMLFLTSIVGAAITQESFGTFKNGECINLIQTCPDCSYVNITSVLYPNFSLAMEESAMIKLGTTYSKAFCNTSVDGDYIVNGVGDLGGVDTIWVYTFKITPSGNSLSTSSSIVQGIMLFIMFGATLMFLFFGTITEVAGVKLFFNILGYISMFLTVGAGYVLLQSSEVQSNVSGLVHAMLFIIGIVLIIIMFFVFINQTRQALQLMRVNKGFGSELDSPQMF